MHDLAPPLGVRFEELLESKQAAHDVLGGLHAIGPHDQLASPSLGAECRRRRGRIRATPHPPSNSPLIGGQRGDEGGRSGTTGRRETGAEPCLPLVAVKSAGAETGHAVEDLGGHIVGEHPEHVRVGERGVQEMNGAQVGPALGQHPSQ